jgi:hypothetical protein
VHYSNSLKEEIRLELVQGLVKDDGKTMLLYLFDNEQIGALGFGKWVTFLWLPFLAGAFLVGAAGSDSSGMSELSGRMSRRRSFFDGFVLLPLSE